MTLLWLLLACSVPTSDNPYGVDADGDGLSVYDGDCDDADPTVGLPHGGCDDADGDGYRAQDGDCDDDDPGVSPAAVEVCGNGVDDDCDGRAVGCGVYGVQALREGDFIVTGPPSENDPSLGQALATGDVNRDGHTDLISHTTTHAYVVLGPLGDARGAIDSQTDWVLTGTSAGYAGMVVGYAGDENWLAIARTDGQVDVYLLGDEQDTADTGLIEPDRTVGGSEVASSSVDMRSGDIDGDGLHELVIGADADKVIGILAGPLREGGWEDEGVRILGSRDFGASVGVFDMDGDGYADVFGSAPSDDITRVGEGVIYGFSGPFSSDLAVADAEYKIGPDNDDMELEDLVWAGADVTLDGQPDLLMVDKDSAQVLAVSGPQMGTTTVARYNSSIAQLYRYGSNWMEATSARASSDALPRLVLQDRRTDVEDAENAVWLFHGPFTPGAPLSVASAELYSDDTRSNPTLRAALGDLNGDGSIDVVAAAPTAAFDDGRVSAFFDGEGL